MGRRARLPGLAHGHARLRREPAPASSPSACTGPRAPTRGPRTRTCTGCRRRSRASTGSRPTAPFTPPPPSPYDPALRGRRPTAARRRSCVPGRPDRGDLRSEPIGEGDEPSLLYINYKAPDYAGHIYNMDDPREEVILAEVDAQLGRLAALLEDRFGRGGFALILTADHGQCPRERRRRRARRSDPAGCGCGRRVQQPAAERHPERRSARDLSGGHRDARRRLAGGGRRRMARGLSLSRQHRPLRPTRPCPARTTARRQAVRRGLSCLVPESPRGRDLSVFGDSAYPEADPGMPPITWRPDRPARPTRAAPGAPNRTAVPGAPRPSRARGSPPQRRGPGTGHRAGADSPPSRRSR